MFADLIYHFKRPYHFFKTGLAQGLPAELKYRFPQKQLKILTITGTDGKTSSSTLLYQVLKAAGKKVGLITTVAAFLGDEEIDTGFHVTAPQPDQVFKFMRRMVDEGYEYLVLETTSHGIYQFRTWGIRPLIAGLTNVTMEHLDYHVNYDNYLTVKASMLRQAQVAIINADDASYNKMKKALRGSTAQVREYSLQESLPTKLQKAVQQRFPEVFNQSNARLVIAMAEVLQIEPAITAAAILAFPGVKGRMQEIPNHRGLRVVVDFAHTPQALDVALTTLRAQQTKPTSKLIAVFGCAGLRDHTKRPVMTNTAVELADWVVLTAEDPRTEDVWSIIREMKEQLKTGHDKVFSIIDRKKAIAFAINELASKGDTVGIFGKGHEQSMCYGKTEYPWSDSVAAQKILESTL